MNTKEKYITLWREPDRLDDLGYNDSKAADVVRDVMDELWKEMTESDLYELEYELKNTGLWENKSSQVEVLEGLKDDKMAWTKRPI